MASEFYKKVIIYNHLISLHYIPLVIDVSSTYPPLVGFILSTHTLKITPF